MPVRRASSWTVPVLLAGVVVVTACDSEPLPTVPQERSLSNGVSRAESLAVGVNSMMSLESSPGETCTIRYGAPGQIFGCAAPVPVVVPSSPWLQHSGGIHEPAQTVPISIRFGGLVNGITMQSRGALKCSGSSLGALVGHRDGVQVARAPNRLTNPSDCGADDVTFGVTGQFPPEVLVDHLVIEGVDPWTFSVFGLQGRARLDYTLTFAQGGEVLVTCLPSPVVRGGQVTCTASALPSTSTVMVSQWRFTSAQLTSQIAEQTSSTSWAGPAATSGQVSVTGTLNGNLFTAQGSIAVTPRDWSTKTARFAVVEKDQSGVLPARPTRVGHLGAAANFAGIFPLPGQAIRIAAGPQNGVSYWADTPVQGESQVYINRIALAVNSPFYNFQPKNNAPAGRCLRSDVLPFIPVVEAHEGLHLEPNSHAETFKRKLNELVPHQTESVVVQGHAGDLLDRTELVTAAAIEQAKLIARDVAEGGTVPPAQYHCNFRYFPK